MTLPTIAYSAGRPASAEVTMKNWLPEVPGGSAAVFAIATTPCVYFAFFGGLSTVLYPGPPEPRPVGSPPWITKPGTIRWKNVSVKKPCRVSETSDAVVFGASFGSSVTVKEPQFVWNTSP